MTRNFFWFINQWIRRKWDEDLMYWHQCVDWVRKFSKDYLGKRITTYGNAIDLWNKWLGKNWRKIENHTWNYPPPGAIVFFSWPTKYGHVCIADERCNIHELRVIEQNAWTGNWDGKWENAIRRKMYNYKTPKCLGWYV